MPLSNGTPLGPYEIVSPLGAGGMGEVYRARDKRLGREVAVKVLPQHLSANPDVRARFEREAKTVSSLNHPHICTLFDVGREGETDYLVMELVDGETLAAKLARGPLSTPEVLKIGSEIADALDRAHRAGVVHRDLKPGNIMITKSGAKLMDFGLARATGLAGPAGSGATVGPMALSPTVAQPLTAEGAIVGTFQYMSPEQLEGGEADARSDLWALGCVLYEMTTGQRAFDGATQASLISSIMRDQPRAMSSVGPLHPPALERLVLQCLAKDADDRWQSAGDLKRELEWLRSGSQAGVPAPVATRARRKPNGWTAVIVLTVAVAAVSAIGIVFGPRGAPQDSARLMRFEIPSPPGAIFANPGEACLSPGGETLAFVATPRDSAGDTRLFVRPIASTGARPLAGTDGASLPFWSPDGRALGFFAKGKLLKVALDGSQPVVLCDAPDGRGGAWSPQNVIAFAPNNQGPIARVSASGGSPAPVTTVDAARHEFGHRYPQFLPDGKHFLYVGVGTTSKYTTFVASIDGGSAVPVCEGGSAARYSPPGFLLFLAPGILLGGNGEGRLLTQRFDLGRLRTQGDPILVSDKVRSNNIAYPNVAVDNRGTLVVQRFENVRVDLDLTDRRGAVVRTAAKQIETTSLVLSPDGRRIAYANVNPADLWVREVESGLAKRLTFNNSYFYVLIWSRDGKRIAYAPQVDGTSYEIRTKPADGSSADSLLFRGPALFSFPLSWSADGRWLVARCSDSTGAFDLWRIPMAGQGKPEIYQRTPETETAAALSPDGRWLAYAAEQNGKRTLYVDSFPMPGSKHEVGSDDPSRIWWLTNGELLYANSSATSTSIWSVPVTTSPTFEAGAPRLVLKLPPRSALFDIAADGQLLLTGQVDPRAETSRLELMMNWPQALESK